LPGFDSPDFASADFDSAGFESPDDDTPVLSPFAESALLDVEVALARWSFLPSFP